MKNFDEIDLNNFVLKTEKEKYKNFYKKENHCCFCGHELEIKTQKKINSAEITETAYCPSCFQNTGQNTYRLN